MSGQSRQHGESLHLIVLGIGRQILFEDDWDRLKFPETLLNTNQPRADPESKER